MKILKSIFVSAVILMIACQAFATEPPSEWLTVAFDEVNQRMHTIYKGPDNVDVFMSYTYEGYCGAVQYYNPDSQQYEEGQWHAGTDRVWCSAELQPIGLNPEQTMTFSADALIYVDGVYQRTVHSEDVLMVVNDPAREGNVYEYAQGCLNENVPEEILIGESYCATICHGSYQIPIFCEDPGYTPQLMQITIQNGCGTETECNSSGCHPLDEFDWNFHSQIFVFPGCNLFLQFSYCGYDEGCICISRSDFFLPVEMNEDFAARAGDAEVTLSWSTASEAENDFFEVLRDGETVARVNSKGNTASGHSYSWTDHEVVNGTPYAYTLASVDIDGHRTTHPMEVSATPFEAAAPTVYSLSQNYPNPFNSETSFSFTIPEAQHVTLTIYDVLGRQVASLVNSQLSAGTYTHSWSAENLATGVYLYTLTAGEFSQTNKMLYLK